MNNIEVEVRSFITQEQYNSLLEFFKNNAKFVKEDTQITEYIDAPIDLRLQENSTGAKLVYKEGNIHDGYRAECEVSLSKESVSQLRNILEKMGHAVKIKWLRHRYQFVWDTITVCIDNTKGYGHIIELEKMSNIENKEKDLDFLNAKFKELHIPLTQREELERKFKYYEQNWRTLLK